MSCQSKSKKPVGRPSIITKSVLDKLEYAFSLGCTDNEACLHAGINPATLYNYQKDNPEFLERKKLLKEEPVLKARQSVISGFSESPELALKYLERKKKDEFSLRQELTGQDGQQLTVVLKRYKTEGADGS